jgi:hypothetical protein
VKSLTKAEVPIVGYVFQRGLTAPGNNGIIGAAIGIYLSDSLKTLDFPAFSAGLLP